MMARTLAGAMVAVLLAGTTVSAQVARPPQDPLAGFFMSARLMQQSLLVVLDDAKGSWKTHFDTAFRQDELVDFSLMQRMLSPESETAKALQGRYGWPEGPRWVLMDRDGNVLQQGTTLPSPQMLAGVLQQAKIPRPVPEAEALARRHPGNHEIQRHLFDALKTRAEKRMEPFLKEGPRKVGVGAGAGTFTATISMRNGSRIETGTSIPELARALTPAEDRRIWSGLAEQLGRVYRGHGWESDSNGVRLPESARYSPVMREAAGRALPTVEEALRRHPGSNGLWSQWVSLSGVAGQRSLRGLLGSLEPLPGTQEFPPDAALDAFVGECRTAQAWAEMREVLEPRWKTDAGAFLIQSFGRSPFADMLQKYRWDHIAGPLVEACLRLGDTGAADRIVQEALQRWGSRNLPTWASQVALKAGNAEKARAWADLKVAAS